MEPAFNDVLAQLDVYRAVPTTIADFANVTNAGLGPLTSLSVSATGTLPDGSLTVATSLDMPDSLAPGDTTAMSVTFTPSQVQSSSMPC